MAKSDGKTTLRAHTLDVLEVVNSYGEEDLVSRAVAVLHDIGKVSPAFQKIVGGTNTEYAEYFEEIPHNFLSQFFLNPSKILELFSFEEFQLIRVLITYHHIRNFPYFRLKKALPVLIDIKDRLVNLLKEELGGIKVKLGKEVDASDLIGFDMELAKGILNHNVRKTFTVFRKPSEIYNVQREYVKSAGLVIFSDHIASYNEKVEKLDLKNIFSPPKTINLPTFKNNWQENLFKSKPNLQNHPNLLVIAPTGSGKTELAFHYIKDRTIFTAPVQVALNQLYTRFSQVFDSVGLLHSNADLFLTQSLSDEEALFRLDLARELVSPILISTADQIFPLAFQYDHFEKLLIPYNCLIVDEIQAYDPVQLAITAKTLKMFRDLGKNVMVMTATFPEFIKPHLGNYEEINLFEDRAIANHTKHFVRLNYYSDLAKLVSQIQLANSIYKRVLVVVNTVKLAKEIYSKLVELGLDKVYLLHARMPLARRNEVENMLTQEFNNPDPKVLVATQVVEASLDIDSDFLFTELAPIPSLVQRFGRVYRRYKPFEPFEVSKPNIEVFIYEKPETRIYPRKQLELSEHLLLEGPYSEARKFFLVKEFYSKCDDLQAKFEKVYALLSNNFTVESRKEANSYFRDIRTYEAVLTEEVDIVLEKLKSVKSYLDFKRNIYAEHVINVYKYELESGEYVELKDILRETDFYNLFKN